MATSSLRTLIWPPPPTPIRRPLTWPTAQPDDDLDCSIDLTGWLADCGDSIVSAAWSIMPSGAGELTARQLVVAGGVATAWLSGGVAGRAHLVKAEFATANGRALKLVARIAIDPLLGAATLPQPGNAGFGIPITWPIIYTGLRPDGSALTLTSTAGWPASSAGLPPGALFANGIFVNAVPGFVSVPGQSLFLGMRAADVLGLGAAGLPQTDPQVAGQYWLNGQLVSVSSGPFTGLAGNGTTLILLDATGYPTSSFGLPPGAVWADGIFIKAVPGATPNVTFPVLLGAVTAADLLAYGAAILPTTDPLVAGQLWLNGVLVCVSAG
jgi:hypothetical protein